MKLLTCASKDLRLFARDRAGLFFTFAFPLLLIAVFGLAFGGGGTPQTLLVVQNDNGPPANAYVTALDNVFNIEFIEDAGVAENKVLDGDASAAVIIPEDFSENVARENVARVRLIYDESKQLALQLRSTVMSITQAFFAQTEPPVNVQAIRGKEYDPFQHFVPGWAITFLFMVGGIGVAGRIIKERNSGTLKRNLLSPIRRGRDYLGSKLLVGFLIACAQLVVFFGVGVSAFGMPIYGSPLLLALIGALTALFGVGLGLVISSFARTTDAASSATWAVALPMCALGGLWWPLELMPSYMQSFAQALPTTHAMNAFRDVIIRGWGLGEILPSLAVLAGFVIAIFVIGLKLFKWEE